jgi:PHD/YefM family antitoxin component YafN of YafNO toxin-antitoxin module
MMAAKEQYLVDENGKRTAVLLDVEYYRELLAAVEEVDSIRAYDEAKASNDEVIPFGQATEEIERQPQ